MHKPGREGLTRSNSPYEVCAGKAYIGHASAGGAGWRAKTHADTGQTPAGQDTVETLKQAYFQGYPESAGCVQGSIDSRNSAIHSAYRISLRPSSLFEPRHPSLKVVNVWLLRNKTASKVCVERRDPRQGRPEGRRLGRQPRALQGRELSTSAVRPQQAPLAAARARRAVDAIASQARPPHRRCTVMVVERMLRVNDPSAGSPTETLLRLLLPLSDKVH